MPIVQYVEIETATERVIHIKYGGTEPVWPAGRRGFKLDPNNANHAIDFRDGFYLTCDANNVFTEHAVPAE